VPPDRHSMHTETLATDMTLSPFARAVRIESTRVHNFRRTESPPEL